MNMKPGDKGRAENSTWRASMEQIEFCKGGGCTAKLGPDILDRVLSRLPAQKKDPDLLVGFDTMTMQRSTA